MFGVGHGPKCRQNPEEKHLRLWLVTVKGPWNKGFFLSVTLSTIIEWGSWEQTLLNVLAADFSTLEAPHRRTLRVL